MDNELSFKSGDIIMILEKENENWWLGSCNGKSGLVPANYLTLEGEEEFFDEDDEEFTATALFDFTAENEGELSFRKGDIIILLDIEDDVWWKGQLNGKVGMLPANHVEFNQSSGESEGEDDGDSEVLAEDERIAVAFYDFTAENDGELDFRAGEEIIITAGEADDVWWSGRIGEREGMFPSSFVRCEV